MTSRNLLIAALAAFLLAVPVLALAQLAEPAPGVAAEPAASVEATVAVDSGGSDEEITAEKLGSQFQRVVSDWRGLGWLAGLAALVTLLVMVLKFGPIDELFVRWEIKWLKPAIAAVLGGILAGIASYLVDGNVLTAIIAGIVIIGPVAVGFFETWSKIKARNRDKGKNGGEMVTGA